MSLRAKFSLSNYGWKYPLAIFIAFLFITINLDRKSTRLNSSHSQISYAVFCLKKKKYMFIPTYTTHLGAAKQLFSYLTSVEGQSAQVAQGGHLAPRIGVPSSTYPPTQLDGPEA